MEELARIKELNRARQQRYYQANKEKVNAKRRELYKAGKKCLGEDSPKTTAIQIQEPTPEPVQIQTQEPAQIQTQEPVEDNNTFEEVFSKLTEQHKKTGKSHLSTLFKLLNNTHTFSKDIQKASKVLKIIETAQYKKEDKIYPYSVNAKKSFIQILLTAITDCKIKIADKQRQLYLNAFNVAKLNSVDENQNKKETETVIAFPELLKLVKKKFGINSKEDILIRLYYDYTLRDDFQLKIVETEKEAKDTSENYIVVPTSSRFQLKLIINNYKTEKRYGTINETINHTLGESIRNYI